MIHVYPPQDSSDSHDNPGITHDTTYTLLTLDIPTYGTHGSPLTLLNPGDALTNARGHRDHDEDENGDSLGNSVGDGLGADRVDYGPVMLSRKKVTLLRGSTKWKCIEECIP